MLLIKKWSEYIHNALATVYTNTITDSNHCPTVLIYSEKTLLWLGTYRDISFYSLCDTFTRFSGLLSVSPFRVNKERHSHKIPCFKVLPQIQSLMSPRVSCRCYLYLSQAPGLRKTRSEPEGSLPFCRGLAAAHGYPINHG